MSAQYKSVSEIFGCNVFGDTVMRERLPKNVYKSVLKTKLLGIAHDSDVADVVAVSAYVSNPSENSLDEYGITCGDVHNKGDGLTANDALMIQKFISGDISDFN